MSSNEFEPLPIRPRPLAGELLSSWIVRLAYAQGQKVETLCVRLFGRGHAVWSRDIDVHPPERIVGKLAQSTGLDAQSVLQLSLEGSKFELGSRNPSAAVLPWITALGVYHRARRQHGLAYCPICLRCAAPYYRKAWRLAFVGVCTEHGCNLLDACHQCGEPLAPHRLDRRGSGFIPAPSVLRMCWSCSADLSQAPAIKASEQLLQFTAQALLDLDRGYAQRGDNSNLHASLYFRGLRRIAAALSPSGTQLESARMESRRTTMQWVARTMSSDAHLLVQTLQQAGVKYSQLVASPTDVPFWLKQEAIALQRSQAPNRAYGEAAAAAHVLENRLGALRGSWLRSVFHLDISRIRLPAELRTGVSWDAFDELIASVEHQVSAASDELTRMRLLQDKVMFILLRFEDWNAESLANLRTDHIAAATRGSPQLDTWILPRCAEQAASWLVWHHVVLRPQLTLHGPCDHEFLSPYTGGAMGSTAIHGRFARAVESAMLRARIPTLTAFRWRR